MELIEKVTLDKIGECKKLILEGETWVKTYFAKKSKGIEIPFVNMSLMPIKHSQTRMPYKNCYMQAFDVLT